MKLEEILPEIREGRRARRKSWAKDAWFDSSDDDYIDVMADDWELVPEFIRVADYFVPFLTSDPEAQNLWLKATLRVGTQPNGSVMIPESGRLWVNDND